MIAAFVTLLCVSAFASSPVERHGALRVEGNKMVNERGERAVLHGVSMGWHSSWPRWYNPDAVAEVVNVWGADVVRAAIGVHPREGYINNPEFAWECLTGVVEGAIENGAYAIVDWHSHAIATQEAVGFFMAVAEKWGEYPNIIYDIYNEPVNDSWDQVKAYSREVIDAIRAVDPDNIIIVGSPHWDQDIHLVAADPLTGYDNLMYSMHFYAATHKDDLRARTQAAIDSGLPVFISECAAMEATGNGPLDYVSWGEWEKLMAAGDVSWVTWSLSEKDESCSMILDGSVPANGGWRDGDLKEWGRFVRDRLQTLAQTKKHITMVPKYPFDIVRTQDGGELKISFFAHASVAFEYGGKRVYIDPVSDFADYSALPKADLIVVGHEHGDHLDPKAIGMLSTPQTIFIGNATAVEALGSGEVLSHSEKLVFPYLTIEAVPAYNISPEKLNFHPRERKHNGYILTFGDTRVYVAGDTEDTHEVMALRDIDIAFLPVNLPYTMTEEQAARAVEAIRPKIFYPYHYGQTDHTTDLGKLEKLLEGSGVEVRIRPLE